MGMMHSSSGKNGYRFHQGVTSIEIEREQALVLIKKENDLRLSEHYQKEYSLKDDLDHFEKVTREIQEQTLKECGFDASKMNQNIVALNNLRRVYKKDPDFIESSVYYKYDISKEGTFEGGEKYQDCNLYTLEGEKTSLKSYLSEKLFILAGSYSWPPLRQSIEKLKDLYKNYNGKINFLFVYILEAHASDEWPLGDHVVIPQHKTLEERLKAAKDFQEKYEFNFPMVVDSMENEYQNTYSVWPERYMVLLNETIDYVSYPTNRGFLIDQLISTVEHYTSN